MGIFLRRWIGPLVLLLVLGGGVGYWFYWNHLADGLRAGLDRWVADRRAEGIEVQHGPVEVSGFPYRLLLNVSAPTVSVPRQPAAPAWSADSLDIYFQPWNLRHVILQPQGAQQLGWDARDGRKATVIRSADTRISVRFDNAGRMETVATDMRELVADGDSPVRQAGRLQFHYRDNDGQAPDRPKDSANLALTGDDIVLASGLVPISDTYQQAALSILLRPVPNGTTPEALDAWRDASGVIDISRIAFLTDRLRVSGDGTVALDLNRRPEGAMTFVVHGADLFIDALTVQGRMSELARVGLRMAVSALEKTDEEGNRTVTLPLTVQDGIVSLLGFKLFPVPPTY